MNFGSFRCLVRVLSSSPEIIAPEATLDTILTATPDGEMWILTDLLGRTVGGISREPDGKFQIRPGSPLLIPMAVVAQGPFRSLDDALAEIEKHTQGQCRRAPL